MRRILRPAGWALFQVPIGRGPTVEDPGETDPAERRRRFGQEDHVRRYGCDFEDRLREAGFAARPVSGRDLVPAREVARYALADESLFFCTRSG